MSWQDRYNQRNRYYRGYRYMHPPSRFRDLLEILAVLAFAALLMIRV